MDSYFKFICFLWILSYTSATENVKNNTECPVKFNVTSLGHSNLLITWSPSKETKSFNEYLILFKPDGEKSWSNDFGKFLFDDGWFKITSPLKENTMYQIKIKNSPEWECILPAKTNPKTNSLPAKPDFKVTMMNELKQFLLGDHNILPKVRIEWLPCGKKGFCKANEIAGADFSIKYKMVDSKQEWRTNVETYMPYQYIYGILPGREYQVVVTSVKGDLKTDSDPQIVSLKTFCSPVQSVKIMPLPDSSILVSWKPPKECQVEKNDSLGYTIFYHAYDNSPVVFLNYSIQEKPHQYQESRYYTEFVNHLDVKYTQSKISSNFTSGTLYKFYIIPRTEKNIHYGFEYQIDYKPAVDKANLPLAKPDFEYTFTNYGYDKISRCSGLRILWLPCGQTYDCKNTRPGSYFVLKYREGNGEIKEVTEKLYDRTTSIIGVDENKKYELWVESVDQSDRVKSDSKIIDTSKCKET